MKNIFYSIVLFTVTTAVIADVGNVTVDRVTVLQDNVYLKVSPAPTTKPSCSTNTNFHYVFPVTTDSGKASFSMVLTAYASQVTIAVKSLDTCSHVSNIEDLRYSFLNKKTNRRRGNK